MCVHSRTYSHVCTLHWLLIWQLLGINKSLILHVSITVITTYIYALSAVVDTGEMFYQLPWCVCVCMFRYVANRIVHYNMCRILYLHMFHYVINLTLYYATYCIYTGDITQQGYDKKRAKLLGPYQSAGTHSISIITAQLFLYLQYCVISEWVCVLRMHFHSTTENYVILRLPR